MARFVDARIPVVFGAEPRPDDYVLRPDASCLIPHPAGCTCCAARDPAALALDRLFLDRVRGAVPWFDRVVVVGHSAAIQRVLRQDAVVAARFRLP